MLDLLRAIIPEGVSRPPKTRCRICDRATKGGKDLCVEHITESTYAKWIASILQAFEDETKRVLRTRSVRSIKQDSPLLKEIILTLHLGSKTTKGLAKDMQIPYELVEVYARYLARHKLAKLRLTKNRDDHYIDLMIVPDAFKEKSEAGSL